MQSKKLWIVTGVKTSIAWPTVETVVEFRGHKILLRPETDKLAPSLALAYEPPVSFEAAEVIIHEFLSVLAWVEHSSIKATGMYGGGHPIGIGKGPTVSSINPDFTLDYLPDAKQPKARLALALYREALNVNSTPYKFLSFYKIINILHRKSNAQKNWINKTVGLLDDFEAKQRVAELKKEGANIGAYLYQSGRNAVAHAYSEPSVSPVNPDEPAHIARLSSDLPVITALAEHLIEHEFRILSKRTVWRQHLYELDGFRAIIGKALVERIKRKERIPAEHIPQLPKLHIRLRRQKPFSVFENLEASVIEGDNGGLLVGCASSDKSVRAGLFLNFADERLQFDPIDGVVLADNGSAAVMRVAIERLRFVKALYLNGKIEVWDADKNELLGRCEAFVPMNIDVRKMVETIDRRITAFETEAKRREELPS